MSVNAINGGHINRTSNVKVTNPMEQKEEVAFKSFVDVDRTYYQGKKDTKNQKKMYEQSLILKYIEQGFGEKDAKKLAKWQSENMVAEDKVRNTIVCWTKEDYDKTKRENPNMNVTMPKKKAREIVLRNPELFLDDNKKFSSDMYKEALFPYIGADYKLNLDERKLLADSFDTSGGMAKHIAKTGGYQVEKDLTWLYRSAAILGSTGLGALGGALISHSAYARSFQAVIGNCFDEIAPQLDNKSVHFNHTLQGASLGALIGTALSMAIKDDGGQCIFQASDIEHIIRDPERGLRNVTNSTHREVLKAIIDDKSLTDDEKIQFVKEAYAEYSGKKVNARELVAAYTGIIEGRKPNREIECPEQECPECPETPAEPETPQAPVTPQAPAAPEAPQPPATPQTPAEVQPVNDCPVRLREEKKVTETKVPTCEYAPKKGEYWFSIVQAKYGTKSFKETIDIVHQLKRAHGITDFTKVTQPKVMHLPETMTTASGENYCLDCNASNIAKATKPDSDKYEKYTGTYTPEVRREEKQEFYWIDCKDQKSNIFLTPQERQEEINRQNLVVVNE